MQSATMADQQLYTIDEVAKILRLHRNTVKKRIESGELGAIQVGREYRISARDLDEYMERMQYKPRDKEQGN